MSLPEQHFNTATMNYVVAGLRVKAKDFRETGLASIYWAGITKTDSAIPEHLKARLRKAVKVLEDTPESLKDWHPNSDNMVLDLVHPSLFPLIYGRSHVLKDCIISLDDFISRCGEGDPIPVPDRPHDYTYSTRFQWLPCNVKLEMDEGAKVKATITSYINNLHPHEHPDFYKVVEEIISHCIPSWNATLTGLENAEDEELRIKLPDDIYKPDAYRLENEFQETNLQNAQDGDFDWDAYQILLNRFRIENLYIDIPEPGIFDVEMFSELSKDPVDLVRGFGHTGLQVIVKLANIHLTPDRPAYSGGSWHVEGQMNEHIVATALYYYDSESITDSYLSFRQMSDDDMDDISYNQGDDTWLSIWFGCENWQSATQEVGSVLCKEGRLLTFPNTFQHRVQSFELADESKPGHRKIIALFLVDPHIHIISTANVPPQQKEWWSNEVLSKEGNRLSKLPRELQDHIISNIACPITLQEAKDLRLELMEERKILSKNRTNTLMRAPSHSVSTRNIAV